MQFYEISFNRIMMSPGSSGVQEGVEALPSFFRNTKREEGEEQVLRHNAN